MAPSRIALACALTSALAGVLAVGCTLLTDLEGLSGATDAGEDALAALDASDAGPRADPIGLGNGSLGSKRVSGQEIVNFYARLSSPVAAGADAVEIEGALFAQGDAVLVWQTSGSVPASPGASDDLVLVDSVGAYELARVARVDGRTIHLETRLNRPYGPAGGQVVRVPEYSDLTIDPRGVLEPQPWNGQTGGIVAVLVRGTLLDDGVIRADATGFRGGEPYIVSAFNCGSANEGPRTNGFAARGEGFFLGGFVTGAAGVGGRGNLFNGGGGGNCHNGGGAGGGNGSRGGPGGAGQTKGGSGVGGLGGAAVAGTLLSRLMMGGGGGAGDQNNTEPPLRGGAGGGVVFIRAGAIDGPGVVSSDGASGASLQDDGAPGGGAGGSILIRTVTTATCGLHANGGAGGNTFIASGVCGPGGGGGAGHILVQSAGGTCATEVASALGGTQPTTDAGVAPAGPTTPAMGIIERPPGAYEP